MFETRVHEICQQTCTSEVNFSGTRKDHEGEVEPKSILVKAGGALEIHGAPKLSWTKLSGTLIPSSEQPIFFEHMVSIQCFHRFRLTIIVILSFCNMFIFDRLRHQIRLR